MKISNPESFVRCISRPALTLLCRGLLHTSLFSAALFGFCAIPVSGGDRVNVIDDFEDGNYRDGTPTRWHFGGPIGSVRMNASSGDLVITSTSVRTRGGAMSVTDYLRDTSTRSQIRLTGEAESVSISAQVPSFVTRRFVAGVLEQDGTLYIQHVRDRTDTFSLKISSDFRVAVEDVVLQLDIIGREASLYAWRPDETMPSIPQATLTLPTVELGWSGAGFKDLGLNSKVTFRYVTIS